MYNTNGIFLLIFSFVYYFNERRVRLAKALFKNWIKWQL